MEGLWMPVYLYEGNKFIIIGNPVYETEDEAKSNGVGDGFSLMASQEVSCVTDEAYCIPFTEEEAEWLVNANFPTHEVAILAGPVYDEELSDES